MAEPRYAITSSQVNASQTRLPSSSHRLPTISASQALRNLEDDRRTHVRSGHAALDSITGLDDAESSSGGFPCGKVTELWGPSGAGKTAIAHSSSNNASIEGQQRCSLDARQPLSGSRLGSVLSASLPRKDVDNVISKHLKKVHVSTVSHLLVLLLHPPSTLLTENTKLLVITGVNAVVDLDYPRYQTIPAGKTEQQKWQAGRRYAILGSLVGALNKLAVLNNLAVIVTTSCSTRMRSENRLGIALVPGIGGQEWDAGIWNRLAIFRDFHGRFIGVQKCRGKSLISREEVGEAGKVISFEISDRGVFRGRSAADQISSDVGSTPARKVLSNPKRPFDEIADSEDEEVDEFGWAEADEQALSVEGLVGNPQTDEDEMLPI